MIAELRSKVHEIKALEVERTLARSSALDRDQERHIRQFGDRLTNKILHNVLVGIKSFADDPRRDIALEVISTLFKLSDEDSSEEQK